MPTVGLPSYLLLAVCSALLLQHIPLHHRLAATQHSLLLLLLLQLRMDAAAGHTASSWPLAWRAHCCCGHHPQHRAPVLRHAVLAAAIYLSSAAPTAAAAAGRQVGLVALMCGSWPGIEVWWRSTLLLLALLLLKLLLLLCERLLVCLLHCLLS
jgi:hypothetical protein